MKNRVKLNVKNLESTLQEKGVRKQEIASKLGVTRETFSRWLSGKVKYVNEENVRLIAQILECDPNLISPEIPPKELGRDLVERSIECESFIKTALFSNQWETIDTLYSEVRRAEILRDNPLSYALFTSLKNLINLNVETGLKIQDGNLKYEVFDTLARMSLIRGINHTINMNFEEGESCFRQVIIQGQSNWIVSFGYLGAIIANILMGQNQVAQDIAVRGTNIFPGSDDELTKYAKFNIFLTLVYISAKTDPKLAAESLNSAKEFAWDVGIQYSSVRIDLYTAFLNAHINKKQDDLMSEDFISKARILPPLFRIESLWLSYRISDRSGNKKIAGNFKQAWLDQLPSSFRKSFKKKGA